MSLPSLTRRQVLALGGLAGVAACGRSRGTPDALTVLLNAEPEHLDPRFPGDAVGSAISRLVYTGLLDSDPRTFEPRLALAEAVDPDGDTHVRVRLRPGVRFQDGTLMTAADVVATYRALLDPAIGSTVSGTYRGVFRDVVQVDDRTVRFELLEPDGTYPSLLQQGILRARDARRPELVAQPGREAEFVGGGAARVTSLEPGAWTLRRTEPGSTFTGLRFLAMHDPNTLALRLLHGDADLGEIKPELFPVFTGRRDFAISSAPGVGFTYLAMRNDHPMLRDVRVRHAFARAIDRDALRTGKLGRYAVAATGPLPPSHWAYEGNVTRHPYDPRGARALLDAALPLRDGVRGPPLTLRISNVRFVMTVGHALREMLGAVGVEVDVRASDLAALLGDLWAGRYDMALLTMPDLSDPWGLGWMFASTSIPTPQSPRAGGNRWRYRNADLDVLLRDGRRAMGVEARRPFYARAQQILADDLPVLPLWHPDVVFAGGPRVRPGWRPQGDGQLGWLLHA